MSLAKRRAVKHFPAAANRFLCRGAIKSSHWAFKSSQVCDQKFTRALGVAGGLAWAVPEWGSADMSRSFELSSRLMSCAWVPFGGSPGKAGRRANFVLLRQFRGNLSDIGSQHLPFEADPGTKLVPCHHPNGDVTVLQEVPAKNKLPVLLLSTRLC